MKHLYPNQNDFLVETFALIGIYEKRTSTDLRSVFCKSASWFREFRKEFTNYQPCVEGSSKKVRLSNYPSSSQYEPKYWNSHRRKDFGQIVAEAAAISGILDTAVKVTNTAT